MGVVSAVAKLVLPTSCTAQTLPVMNSAP